MLTRSFSLASTICNFSSSRSAELSAGPGQVQPLTEIDLMTHHELVDEHVDLPVVRRVPEIQTASPVQRIERLVRHVTRLAQQRREGLAIGGPDGNIQIPVGAGERRLACQRWHAIAMPAPPATRSVIPRAADRATSRSPSARMSSIGPGPLPLASRIA